MVMKSGKTTIIHSLPGDFASKTVTVAGMTAGGNVILTMAEREGRNDTRGLPGFYAIPGTGSFTIYCDRPELQDDTDIFWVADTDGTGADLGGGGGAISTLSDVDLGTLNDGEVLTYNGTTFKWENVAPSGGAETDPIVGAITGIVKANGAGTISAASAGTDYVATETDPVFTASDAFSITSTQITNWDTAYGWGDHSGEGYLTAETDPVYSANTYATGMNQDVDTTASPTFVNMSTASNIAMLGNSMTVSGTNAIGIGYSGSASAANTVVIGNAASANQSGAIAIGNSADSGDGTNTVVIGNSANTSVSGNNSIAIGNAATIKSEGGIAIGISSIVDEESSDSIAIGASSSVTNGSSIAMGSGATVSSSNSIAIGLSASSTGTSSISIGNSASSVAAADSISIGNTTIVYATSGIAIGKSAEVTSDSDNSISIGVSTSIEGVSNIALGHLAGSTATSDAISIGHSAFSSGVRSVAIGKDMSTTVADQMVFGTNGTARITVDGANGIVTINDILHLTPRAEPASGTAGDVYYDSTANKLRFYNGATWGDV